MLSLLNDLGFANWRFVISTVDHIATLQSSKENKFDITAPSNNTTTTIDKKYCVLIIVRFFNGANKYAIFARDFAPTVGALVNTFTSSELTVTYSSTTGWSVTNHVGGNVTVYALIS